MSRSRLMLGSIAVALITMTFGFSSPSSTHIIHVAQHKTTSVKSASTVVNQVAVQGYNVTVTKFPSKNSTLSGIANNAYHNPALWARIYNANRAKISNPNRIYVGQVLFVPQAAVINIIPPAPKPKPTTPQASGVWFNPLPNAVLTSCFGMRWGVMHKGIDMAKPTGTPIHATGSGTVVSVGWVYNGYGISVMVNHGNGYYSHYAHMSRAAVSKGQHVSANQILGYVGATGDATGPHLHFEIHQGRIWNQIPPSPWLRAHGVPIGC